jgi:RNA polymerase sigma-70 factor (ECF subfamily)
MPMSDLTDEQLVEQIRSQDQELFRELVRRYQSKIHRYARTFTADESMQADIVQSAFVRAFEYLHSCDTSRSFSNWMYRISRNQAIRIISENKQQIRWEDTFDFEDESSDANITDAYIRKELTVKMNHLITLLPLLYREPISLYFYEEKSYDEISEILRVPTATVVTRLRRGKKLLQHYVNAKKI